MKLPEGISEGFWDFNGEISLFAFDSCSTTFVFGSKKKIFFLTKLFFSAYLATLIEYY